MNFLIDANLPRRITRIFQERGHSAVHTLDLPEGNETANIALLDYSEKNNCALVNSAARWMTPAEKILWEELRANKLGVHFRRQQVRAGG